MSNQPHDGGTSDVPINAPSGQPGRPQPPANPAQGGPRPPAGAAPRQPSAPPPQGAPAPPPGAPVPPPGTQRQPVTPRQGLPPRTTGSHGRLPAAQQRQPIDLATRLDGQRGWLAQIDNSLKKRSIIALVLTCLAVGVGAAAIYISLTKNSDGDRLDALQTRVEALEAAAGIPSTDSTIPDTGVTLPETGVTLPDTGVTLPEGTLPEGTTDGSGLVIPPSGE